MPLKLASLQHFWGVAGAREKFEEMVSQLIHVERANSKRVRIVRGDGGLDSFEGDLTDPAGIDVYQVKYFPSGLGNSQKQQIRTSFSTVRGKKEFKVKSWTLCIPIDMSIDETVWFENWVANQKDSNIEILTPWNALHIEGLLLQEKNRLIREAFFREENTELLRKQDSHLENILTELKQRSDRKLKVRINPVWIRNQLHAQVQLFNSGSRAIYIESWWIKWEAHGKKGKGGQQSVETIQGKLPIRLEEHDKTDLLIRVDSKIESLSGIGVFDGDQHLWLATDENLIVFKHNATTHQLPGVDEPKENLSLEGIEVEVQANATRPIEMNHDRLEVIFRNLSNRVVSVQSAQLRWTYTPPRQGPDIPGEPSVSEAGASVTLSRQSMSNLVAPGEQVLFFLDHDISYPLIEIARGDVLDEDIVVEIYSGGGKGWSASMNEIPAVVRGVANSVVESMKTTDL